MLTYHSLSRYFREILDIVEKKAWYKRVLVYALLTLITALSIYVRAIPAMEWGIELHGNDPWIAFWETKYVYENGLLSWWSLTPDNPDTHIFWYPIGRDFASTDYPGIALWTALTYPLAKLFGVTLKEWLALQPLLFAALSSIIIFFTLRELLNGSNVAGLIGSLLYAIVPATSDRTIIGFVEKEGVALTFIFLFLYFYIKMLKVYTSEKKLLYTIFAALSLSGIGWFWGGYIYVYASIPLSLTLYPIFIGRKLSPDVIKYNFLLIILSLLFVLPVNTIIKILGIVPFRLSIGVIALGLFILPYTYYLFGVKKRVLTRGSYLLLLLVIAVTGFIAILTGIVQIGGRYAYALGLKPFMKLGPLVESIEEHQPAIDLERPMTFIRVLYTWGWTGFFLSIIGALYLLYKNKPETIYIGIAFLIALYAYINVTYFEALASSLGVVTASVFLATIVTKILPSRTSIDLKKARRKRRRTTATIYRRSIGGTILLIILLLAFLAPMIHSTTILIDTHENMIPSIMAAGTSIVDKNDAWYKLIDFIRENISRDALIITWWDYGYWISVLTGRSTVADGATLNETQISILARILTSLNESETIMLLKKLKAPLNNTYILVFDVFYMVETNNTVYVIPYIRRNPYEFYPTIDSVGLVDIRKSIWMIRIGKRDPGTYLYIYSNNNAIPKLFGINLARYYISPFFGKPWDLPLIYRMVVNGILYLSKETGKEYHFIWLNGTEAIIPAEIRKYVEPLGIKHSIDVVSVADLFGDKYYNLSSMKYIKPYKIIAEPFQNNKYLYVVIFLFKVEVSND